MPGSTEVEFLRAKAFEYHTRARRLAGPPTVIAELKKQAARLDALAEKLEWDRIRAARAATNGQ